MSTNYYNDAKRRLEDLRMIASINTSDTIEALIDVLLQIFYSLKDDLEICTR